MRFGGTAARWLDAGSWHQAALPSPVPHSERVPCSSGGDSVLFPENITYRARVQRAVAVSALTVGPHVSAPVWLGGGGVGGGETG